MAASNLTGSILSIDYQDYADCRIVSVTGRVDHTNSTDFLDNLSAHAEEAGGMVIDLSRLDFITSAGLRALLLAHRTIAAKDGRMAVAGVSGSVREVFRISKFDALLNVTDSVADGVAQISDAARAAYPD